MSNPPAQTCAETERLYPPLTGAHYLNFLSAMHRNLNPTWYLEVGTSAGHSLKQARSNFVAIDPNFRVSQPIIGTQQEGHFFQGTSDDVFASGRVSQIVDAFDLAFLDGLHLFEFLLRDFIATEKLSRPESTIVMHDIVPITRIAAARTWDHEKTRAWTGDVWKLVPILREYRPDLTLEIVDCPPSGLAIITCLDPSNQVLQDNYQSIVADFSDLSIDQFGKDKLLGSLDIMAHNSAEISKHCGNEFLGK